jgi:hypothetical protein
MFTVDGYHSMHGFPLFLEQEEEQLVIVRTQTELV